MIATILKGGNNMFFHIFLINLFTVYIPLLLIGYFMPNFIKKTLLFGVVIPEEASKSDEALYLTKIYKRNFGLSAGLISILINFIAFKNQNPNILAWGVMILIGLMSANYVYIHNKAKELKIEKGWTVNKKQIVVVDTSHSTDKGFISLHWFWLPTSIFIFTLLFTMIQYPHLPEQIPTHFDFYGNPTTYKVTSFTAAFGLPLAQAGMTAMFYFILKIIKRVKPNINPAKPKTSSIQNKIAKRYWGIYLLFVLAVLNMQFAYIQLNVLQVLIPSMITNFIIQGFSIGTPLLGAIVVTLKTGQSGNRIKVEEAEEASDNIIDREDDQFWKWGMIYYNPQDPSLFIEKRFGIGWTINFGRPFGMAFIFITIIAIMATLILPVFLR